MINPNFIKKLQEFCTDDHEVAKGIHFGFLYTFKDDIPYLEEYFLEGSKSVFPYEDYQIYAINLLKKDVETGKTHLIIPLFATKDEGEFQDFLKILSRYHINSKGHLNNQLGYAIFGDTDKDEFYVLKSKLEGDFDIKKLAEVVSKYYETTNFALKLSGYFKNSCLFDYNGATN